MEKISFDKIIGYSLRDTGGYFAIDAYSDNDREQIGSVSPDYADFVLKAIHERHFKLLAKAEPSQ